MHALHDGLKLCGSGTCLEGAAGKQVAHGRGQQARHGTRQEHIHRPAGSGPLHIQQRRRHLRSSHSIGLLQLSRSQQCRIDDSCDTRLSCRSSGMLDGRRCRLILPILGAGLLPACLLGPHWQIRQAVASVLHGVPQAVLPLRQMLRTHAPQPWMVGHITAKATPCSAQIGRVRSCMLHART